MADAARRADRALGIGLLAIPLWALSYVWPPFRHVVPEPAWVWPAVVVGKVGAVVAALAALILALRSLRQGVPPPARTRALLGAVVGGVVLLLVVGLNILWTFFVPI